MEVGDGCSRLLTCAVIELDPNTLLLPAQLLLSQGRTPDGGTFALNLQSHFCSGLDVCLAVSSKSPPFF